MVNFIKIDDPKKRMEILENFKEQQGTKETQQLTNNIDELKIESNDDCSNLVITSLNYKDKSVAGYSVKYNPENNNFTIGNKNIKINKSNLIINEKTYKITNGLLELLLKNSPNFNLITNEDKNNYKQILIDSSAIYKNYDSTQNRVLANRSKKWKFIKNELFPKKKVEINDKDFDLNKTVNKLKKLFKNYDPNRDSDKIQQILTSLKNFQLFTQDELDKIIFSLTNDHEIIKKMF